MEEQAGDNQTRVYVDNDLMVLWHANDCVSIFNKYTYNQEYRFTGKTGANSGTFSKVPSDDFITGNALDYVYAVYPYRESTEISNQGVISIELPTIQSYSENSFGIGANTMVACSNDNELMFKNLCGYFLFRMYGDNITVTSISLKGNKNEPLAGLASVYASDGVAPSVSFGSSASRELVLSFESPVTIGSTAETATSFWLVVPPTVFNSGFTITVKDANNGVFEKSTSQSIEVKRNTLTKMSAIKVVPEYPSAPSFPDGFTIMTGDSTPTPLYASIQGSFTAPEDITGVAWSTMLCLDTKNTPNNESTVYRFGAKTGDLSYTFNNLEPNTTYYYCAALYYSGNYYYGETRSFRTPNLPMTGFVDLGIGVKWATCNLGASTTEDDGDYYAWGETSSKPLADFTREKYKYYDVEGETYISIGQDISKTQYDAAYAYSHGDWRMPTRAEAAALRNECTWTSATYNNKSGHLVKGKNGSFIFVVTVSCTETSSSKLRYSQFWTSTLAESGNYYANDAAYYMNYDYFNVTNTFRAQKVEREVGLPVRPVKD